MAVFAQIRSDFAQRKNLDVYVTIVAGIVVCVLSLVDVVPVDKTPSIVLGLLAILAFNVLATRAAVERSAAAHATLDRFTEHFPPDINDVREASADTLLIGVDLARTIEQSYGAFERRLREGARLRILLTDPEAGSAALHARHQRSNPDDETIQAGITASLRTLRRLKQDVGGDLQVRTTHTALTFGLNFTEGKRHSGTLFVQLYGYRLHGESRPHFRLTRRDGPWYECYEHQAETLWADCADFDFDRLGA
ncbi:hypothetical protein [Streptomyces sp. NBC_01304]|uniref:hypothetical protein n=1 Tax=Streptomyces sp. NBC_01304 TaxID=2903818 RepID=UPI002E147612|nr:hypothetical protein OG430_16790 [Streptomyces sp. NBC_01304]